MHETGDLCVGGEPDVVRLADVLQQGAQDDEP